MFLIPNLDAEILETEDDGPQALIRGTITDAAAGQYGQWVLWWERGCGSYWTGEHDDYRPPPVRVTAGAWRKVPDPTGDYRWRLHSARSGTRGSFRASLVTIDDRPRTA